VKAVIQRVLRAAVYVDGNKVSAIESGLLIFLGVMEGDTDQTAGLLAEKRRISAFSGMKRVK
jgi:D-Tyr-tRNAtyr deacylase